MRFRECSENEGRQRNLVDELAQRIAGDLSHILFLPAPSRSG